MSYGIDTLWHFVNTDAGISSTTNLKMVEGDVAHFNKALV